ncbi:mannose-6-phosphate isomerase, class I [Pseudarthrobacter sp. J75]|uniref:mannose-6-phosphate isomerase, class I n=1 Tax=unclassified Pseudarthrobacter TaxID=2647000 RepID=UPI002E816591|nr:MULTISPECIES: mannose-6-phosphate isomerase, class I [unclassified Pseudarthrobacter]MEE2521627.1 mannose-6-phosphate isomerase, class I [Pseudarthrobacter sp. J47]MEE2527704.1 mannose-6-phosphate isomerase, class I [Pseudarthrobacter sp. J75]MEE2570903.1 mannose-6-phosphate isomerase, class I [Pseudarthrobacter sp. J64]
MYKIENVIRDYAWGSTTAIADFLGRPAQGGPEAELWIGAHPDSPSVAVLADGSQEPLDALISSDPRHFLGDQSVQEFGPRLPFLAKILAADTPLSLQVHPSLEQAREGFKKENDAGVPTGAPYRNYRDDNHKPEMIFALTDFEALCGFRPASETREIFAYLARLVAESGQDVPPLLGGLIADLSAANEATALRAAFQRIIAGGEEVTSATALAVEALEAARAAGASAVAGLQPAFDTVLNLNELYPGDPGVLNSLLLNRISLSPGEAVYLPAGKVHAYLKGLGVEVMAASDNVLRGGLTPKHIDVPELLKTIRFESVAVPRLETVATVLGQELYQPPFREFQLQRIELAPGSAPVPLAQAGAAVLIVASGSVFLDSPKGDLKLERGESAFLPAAEAPVNVHPAAGSTGPAVAFAVTTALR